MTASRTLNAERYDVIRYATDIAVQIPPGYVGVLKERSSIRKKGLVLLGGVIDSGYTGPIEVAFKCEFETSIYSVGERICQIVILPLPSVGFVEVQTLGPTARGNGGFGSTGV